MAARWISARASMIVVSISMMLVGSACSQKGQSSVEASSITSHDGNSKIGPNSDLERLKLQAELEKAKAEAEVAKGAAMRQKEDSIKARARTDALAVFRKEFPERHVSKFTINEISVAPIDDVWFTSFCADIVAEVFTDAVIVRNTTSHRIRLFYDKDSLRLDDEHSIVETINNLQPEFPFIK